MHVIFAADWRSQTPYDYTVRDLQHVPRESRIHRQVSWHACHWQLPAARVSRRYIHRSQSPTNPKCHGHTRAARTHPPPWDILPCHARRSVHQHHPCWTTPLQLTSQSAHHLPFFVLPFDGLVPSPPPIFPANTGHASKSCGPSHSSHLSSVAAESAWDG